MTGDPIEDSKNLTGCLKGCGVMVVFVIVLGVAVSAFSDDKPRAACTTVSPEIVELLESGLDQRYGLLTLRNAQAIAVSGAPGLYIVGADIQGPNMSGEDEVAAWASND